MVLWPLHLVLLLPPPGLCFCCPWPESRSLPFSLLFLLFSLPPSSLPLSLRPVLDPSIDTCFSPMSPSRTPSSALSFCTKVVQCQQVVASPLSPSLVELPEASAPGETCPGAHRSGTLSLRLKTSYAALANSACRHVGLFETLKARLPERSMVECQPQFTHKQNTVAEGGGGTCL